MKIFSNAYLSGLFLFSLVASIISCQTTKKTALPDNVLIVRNGIIIDGNGGEAIPHGLLAIQSDTILAIGLEADFRLPKNAEVIDAEGGTILPGFIDSHTHILGRQKNRENIDSLRTELSLWLKSGITTIRDLGSHYGKTGNIPNLKNTLKEWGNSVPGVVLAGPYITAPEGHPISAGMSRDWVYEVADEDEARLAAEEVLSLGADGLKIAVERGESEEVPILTAEQVAVITDVAHNHNTWASAHITFPEDAKIAVLNGIDDLAHPPAGKISDALIQDMITREVLLGTTLLFQDGKPETGYWLRRRNLEGVDTSENRRSQIKEYRRDFFQKFQMGGGKITLGSDYPYYNFGRPGGMPHEELQKMIEMGMEPMDVIIASTANGAKACGLQKKLGTLAIGKKADIIIIRDNPLENISALRNVFVVIKNGEIVVSFHN